MYGHFSNKNFHGKASMNDVYRLPHTLCCWEHKKHYRWFFSDGPVAHPHGLKHFDITAGLGLIPKNVFASWSSLILQLSSKIPIFHRPDCYCTKKVRSFLVLSNICSLAKLCEDIVGARWQERNTDWLMDRDLDLWSCVIWILIPKVTELLHVCNFIV